MRRRAVTAGASGGTDHVYLTTQPPMRHGMSRRRTLGQDDVLFLRLMNPDPLDDLVAKFPFPYRWRFVKSRRQMFA